MATLSELLADACADGFAAETSQVRLLQLIAQLLNTSDMTTDEILADACETGIADITSLQKLLVIIAQLLQSGGGGGGSTQVFCGHYGGGDPTDVPTTACALAYDLDPDFALWHWDGAAWT